MYSVRMASYIGLWSGWILARHHFVVTHFLAILACSPCAVDSESLVFSAQHLVRSVGRSQDCHCVYFAVILFGCEFHAHPSDSGRGQATANVLDRKSDGILQLGFGAKRGTPSLGEET